MIVVTRHRISPGASAPESASGATFLADAEAAALALAQRPGCQSVEVARALDDASTFLLISRWSDVGSYRRALSNFDVKVAAVPVLSSAVDEASAFEVLAAADPHGLRRFDSDRATDADTAGPL